MKRRLCALGYAAGDALTAAGTVRDFHPVPFSFRLPGRESETKSVAKVEKGLGYRTRNESLRLIAQHPAVPAYAELRPENTLHLRRVNSVPKLLKFVNSTKAGFRLNSQMFERERENSPILGAFRNCVRSTLCPFAQAALCVLGIQYSCPRRESGAKDFKTIHLCLERTNLTLIRRGLQTNNLSICHEKNVHIRARKPCRLRNFYS